MEAAPPSYEKATRINAWDLVARYIPSRDLCSAALVCQSWNAIFVPHLWGNPAAHFGTENDRVYVALTRFKQTLYWSRLYVRSFTHTLHLPPAHAEIYNGPHADWLREVLDRLPNLQSLIVRGLPFFDHAALLALKYRHPDSRKETDGWNISRNAVELPDSGSTNLPRQPVAPSNVLPTYGLRLLDASRCTNTTATGLCEALKRLDQLLYLDLSYTYAARDNAVLASLRSFPGLQVVKLRGINLRDDDLKVLAGAIGTRVRSLDLRNNQLTDRSARTLLDNCFIKSPARVTTSSGQSLCTRSTSLLPYMGADMLAIYQGRDFEGHLRHALTTSFVTRLAFEDAPEGGITHLYISENRFSVEGISGLLRSSRLHVLDAKVDARLSEHQKSYQRDSTADVTLPGAEKLSSLFTDATGENIRHMRISHDLVTRRSANPDDASAVPGRIELPETRVPPADDAAELQATEAFPIFHELPAESIERHELPGDPIQVVVTPAMGDAPGETEAEKTAFDQARRGSAVAPEPVTGQVEAAQHPSLDSPAMFSPMTGTFASSSGQPSPLTPTFGQASIARRPRTYSNVLEQRKARTRHMLQCDSFHPGLVPHAKQIILTEVPPFSSDEELGDRLVAFVRLCAEEASLALQQARTDYTLPPGHRFAYSAVRDAAKQIFALDTLVLEMSPDLQQQKKPRGSKWRHNWTKSMIEDADINSLWTAAESDFSFFGEDEEVRFPSLEPNGRSMFMQAMAEKQVASNITFPSTSNESAQSHQELEPRVDILAKLSQFRKSRKAAYDAKIAQGDPEPEVEGYWPGVIKIIRPNANYNPFTEEDEVTDYYGNTFSKGYLYK